MIATYLSEDRANARSKGVEQGHKPPQSERPALRHAAAGRRA
jgi:hypothetical protein